MEINNMIIGIRRFFVAGLILVTHLAFGQETLQTVTDRGNTTTNSLQIGGASVNANTTKLFINNPYGNNWALSSGANMISEHGFHIYNWSASPTVPYFSIINGGNVGIGTVSPDSKLHVYAPGGTVFKAIGSSAYLLVDNVGSGENYYSANAAHYFQIGGVNKMMLNSAGNLSVNGVGVDGLKLWSTSHPSDYFLSNTWDGTYWQLKSNHPAAVNVGHADNAAYATNSGGLGGNAWGGTVLSNAPATLFGIDPTTGIYQYNANALKSWLGMGTAANLTADVNPGAGTVVQRNSGGYIFGTYLNMSDPAVDGTPFTDFVTTNNDGFLRRNSAGAVKTALAISLQDVTAVGNTTTTSLQIGGAFVNANTTKLLINNPSGNNWALSSGANNISEHGFHIYNWSASPNTPYFSIVNGGNVGVGTFSPDEKLTVNGKIKANEIRVNGAGAPDYVFEEGYKVATLEALESYIKANKHLPEVPSAKEFERDGIAVGEMNKLLLKKIEELTLHLIEKDKELTREKEINKKQNDKISAIEAAQVRLETLLKKMEAIH